MRCFRTPARCTLDVAGSVCIVFCSRSVNSLELAVRVTCLRRRRRAAHAYRPDCGRSPAATRRMELGDVQAFLDEALRLVKDAPIVGTRARRRGRLKPGPIFSRTSLPNPVSSKYEAISRPGRSTHAGGERLRKRDDQRRGGRRQWPTPARTSAIAAAPPRLSDSSSGPETGGLAMVKQSAPAVVGENPSRR